MRNLLPPPRAENRRTEADRIGDRLGQRLRVHPILSLVPQEPDPLCMRAAPVTASAVAARENAVAVALEALFLLTIRLSSRS